MSRINYTVVSDMVMNWSYNGNIITIINTVITQPTLCKYQALSFQDVLEALKSLSSFFNENNLRSRRNLRGDIEHRSLSINEDFVTCFQEVKEQLDAVYGDVKSMNDCCEDMTSRLKVDRLRVLD